MLAKEFKTLVLPLSNKLLHFAIKITNNEEEARDAIQDVLLKLWQKRETLKKVDNIEAYAMRMTRNRCLDIHRLKRTISVEDKKLYLTKEPKGDLNRELELSETASLIKKIIVGLPDIQGKIIRMRDIEQLSYDEIEKLTGQSVNTIRVNLSRARKKVRDELLIKQGYGIERDQTNIAKIF